MVDSATELKNIIEAALFASESPLSVQKVLSLFPDDARPTRDEVLGALEEVQADCGDRGVTLKKVGSGYRFQSKEKYAPWLRRLSELRPPRYSRALLETLAIIAYRQPVTRGDIEEIRGVSVSTETIRTLLNREWIRQLGQREVPGRPALYGTTKAFLDYFNLNSLNELPTLVAKRDPAVIAQELNLALPLEQADTLSDGVDADSISEAKAGESGSEAHRGTLVAVSAEPKIPAR